MRWASFILAMILLASTAFAGNPADTRDVLATVRTLLDAWREADVAKAERVLHKDYRAESWQDRSEGRYLFLETRDELLAQIKTLRPGLWDVRLLQTNVSIDSNGLAVVWAKYDFYFDGKPDHCGHESYTLLRVPEGWRVVNFADSDTPLRGRERSTVCPE